MVLPVAVEEVGEEAEAQEDKDQTLISRIVMVLVVGVHIDVGHGCQDEVHCNHDGAHGEIEL